MHKALPLHYLSFEASDDGDGTGTWDAMASVRPEHTAAVEAEIKAVLDWTHRHLGVAPAPLDEGGLWDTHHARWQEEGRITHTLTLTGPLALGDALAQAFDWD